MTKCWQTSAQRCLQPGRSVPLSRTQVKQTQVCTKASQNLNPLLSSRCVYFLPQTHINTHICKSQVKMYTPKSIPRHGSFLPFCPTSIQSKTSVPACLPWYSSQSELYWRKTQDRSWGVMEVLRK